MRMSAKFCVKFTEMNASSKANTFQRHVDRWLLNAICDVSAASIRGETHFYRQWFWFAESDTEISIKGIHSTAGSFFLSHSFFLLNFILFIFEPSENGR